MTLTIVVTGLVMLIAPIWILVFTRPVALKLAVITIFILLFLVLVALATYAKSYESLAATAA
jgi:tryptophan-rich sensory protein